MQEGRDVHSFRQDILAREKEIERIRNQTIYMKAGPQFQSKNINKKIQKR